MTFKIKPPRDKLKRRGSSFRIETPDGQTYVFRREPGRSRYLAELIGRNFHFHDIQTSDCGAYVKFKGVAKTPTYQWNPIQWIVTLDRGRGKKIAGRISDDTPWFFADDSSNFTYIAADQVPFRNAALIAAARAYNMPLGLMTFLGFKSPMLCDAKIVGEIEESPRYALLRDFQFNISMPDQLAGKGRQAQNKVRHEHTNYDEMLQAASGLLYPEQYETVRRGVDAIVASNLRRARP
jgi:hypothetical protein